MKIDALDILINMVGYAFFVFAMGDSLLMALCFPIGYFGMALILRGRK